MNADDPHYARKEAILAAFPQVRTLFGPDLRTLWYVAAVIGLQSALAVVTALSNSMVVAALLGLTLGPYLDAGILVIMHELSHNRCTGSMFLDRMISIFANAPMLAPIR